ncbi:MAG: DUF1722 domain-containing protein [Gammaproteobacteria bacterium]|nr:DUF1722 domain-containing protein [Gammaproteobacteria bacterium]
MSTREKSESTENELLLEKIRVGVSSCLLGQEVRFDGGHKRDNYLTGTLSGYFDFIPFCPEAAVGLGIPRQPIRLVRRGEEIRAVGVRTPELDPTDQLAAFAERTARQLGEISGYILKKDSPSCGMERVKIYNDKGMPERKGVGIYAGVLMQRLPLLPVEEEGRLGDAVLRENFIERVFVYHRWQRLVRKGLSAKGLIEFHSDHKFLILSHQQKAYRELGRLVANAGGSDLEKLAGEYVAILMNALKRPARPRKHVNVLEHLLGFLKEHLDKSDREEMAETIAQYREGLLPLIVPITLIRHHFRRHPDPYIQRQYYISPHPKELMLRNSI